MSGSPSFPQRAWFGIIILLITAIAILYANIDFSDLKLRIANIVVFAAIFIVYSVSVIESYSELLRFEEVCLYRDRLADKALQEGKKDIIIEDNLFIEKESPLVILDLKDWLVLEESFSSRYGQYKGANTISIQTGSLNEPHYR